MSEKQPNRFDYVKYDQVAQSQQDVFKQQMMGLDLTLSSLKNSRYKSLALTSLEEAYCWMGKAIRDDQIERNGSADR